MGAGEGQCVPRDEVNSIYNDRPMYQWHTNRWVVHRLKERSLIYFFTPGKGHREHMELSAISLDCRLASYSKVTGSP